MRAGTTGTCAPAFPDVIDVCDKLGTPKLLFQVKTLQERASEFLPAPGTYYVCRVELGTPGRRRAPPVPVVPAGHCSGCDSSARRHRAGAGIADLHAPAEGPQRGADRWVRDGDLRGAHFGVIPPWGPP